MSLVCSSETYRMELSVTQVMPRSRARELTRAL